MGVIITVIEVLLLDIYSQRVFSSVKYYNYISSDFKDWTLVDAMLMQLVFHNIHKN